eukprot:gene34009-52851_t
MPPPDARDAAGGVHGVPSRWVGLPPLPGQSIRMVERGGTWPLDPPFPHGYYGSPALSFVGCGVLLPGFVGAHWRGALDRALARPRLRAGIWTIHYGYDERGNDNYDGLVSLLNRTETNVIGLLETDISRIVTANRDFVEYAATRLGMHSDYGSPTLDSTFGCAVLSKFPFVSVTRYVLPSPQGELSCLIHAVIDVREGRRVNVVVAHFGNTEHVLDRQLQSRTIVNNVTGWVDTAKALRALPHHRNTSAKGGSVWRFPKAGTEMRIDPADKSVFAGRYEEGYDRHRTAAPAQAGEAR